jgi:hypothetical protein
VVTVFLLILVLPALLSQFGCDWLITGRCTTAGSLCAEPSQVIRRS